MISLPEAKAHLKVDHAFEDELIAGFIESATRYLERRTGWVLGEPEEVTEHIYGTGTPTLWLKQPAESVEVEGVDYEDYELRGSRLYMVSGVWPRGEVFAVTYDAGFEEDAGPADLMQAVRLIVGGWHKDREAWVTGTITADVKVGVDQLVGTYERVRS